MDDKTDGSDDLSPLSTMIMVMLVFMTLIVMIGAILGMTIWSIVPVKVLLLRRWTVILVAIDGTHSHLASRFTHILLTSSRVLIIVALLIVF